jgi:hypothetical protein
MRPEIEPLLLELVKTGVADRRLRLLRHMHSKDARALGESEQRLHLLAASREAPCYGAGAGGGGLV